MRLDFLLRGKRPAPLVRGAVPFGIVAREARVSQVSRLKAFGALTGVLGVILYGLLRLTYALFYAPLGTTPEEVGHDYSRILSESIAGVVELTLFVAVPVSALTILFDFLARVVAARVFHRPNHAPVRARDLLRLPPRGVAQRSLVIAAAIVFLLLPILALEKTDAAQHGQGVHNLYLVAIPPYLPVLGLQASPADVTWKDGDAGRSLPLSKRRCLMYLGQANGTSVFYDAPTRDTLQLPSSDIVVVVRDTPSVPEDLCSA